MSASRVAGLNVSEISLPIERDLLAGGMRLHYLEWGDPRDPAVVLLHGGGLNAHTWDLVCLLLRQRFHCVALDLRGHGESEWSPNIDYGIVALTKDLGGFVNGVQLDRFALVGMSLGGLTSIAFAAANPRRVRGLVLVDVGPDVQSPVCSASSNLPRRRLSSTHPTTSSMQPPPSTPLETPSC